MLKKYLIQQPQSLRAKINERYRADEKTVITELLDDARLEISQTAAIREQALKLVTLVRAARKKSTGIDSFLTEYSLSTDEGIALMCLAEALLRVPDNQTIDKLIKDKLTKADWQAHQGQSDSFFVNATTWALMLTGKVLAPEKAQSTVSSAVLSLMGKSGGELAVRMAVDKAMRIMSKQFVTGRTISEALTRAKKKQAQGYRYSYDMLGEAALTEIDAERYLKAYTNAIEEIGREAQNISQNLYQKPGISIKLSALHPRYQEAQRERVLDELTPKLLKLSQLAKQYNISLTIDAEESERLDLSLDIIEQVFSNPKLDNWNGFGMAVQSYQKRAFFLLDWVADLARKNNKRMMVRLIKGAYWDSEIKKSQIQGLEDYPVFSRKVFTDVSFQACAKKLLTMTDAIYPQFATHNAYSVAMILNLVGDYRDFEFQCLHGMGVELYEHIVPKNALNIPCRIYAPVGTHEDLLPYLVRRLLENGANSSFVNRIVDDQEPIEDLVFDPVSKASELVSKINQNIPLPKDIFLPLRQNSKGIDLSNRATLSRLQEKLAKLPTTKWTATPLIAEKNYTIDKSIGQNSPQQKHEVIANVVYATTEDAQQALKNAELAFSTWRQNSVASRVKHIERFAQLLEDHTPELLSMLCVEAGKTWNDGIGEIREAIDFCHYYASMATKILSHPTKLQGYTGELNEWSLHPRGVLLCISPWNFPLAIFTGQIIAALVTGNCVIAKPAEQTSCIAYYAVKLMHSAGIPTDVIQLLPGDGAKIGKALLADERIKGVIFTGSTQTAHIISKQLANRGQEITPLIAETGGQNVMIVDSSALLEQVVVDVIASAFGSAGQRCSALRAIYVQKPVYARFIELLKGAMAELRIGDPRWLETDVGPVIDAEALQNLQTHVTNMLKNHKLIYQCNLTSECKDGYFMPPTAIEINHLSALKQEVFGPVLHVLCFERDQLDQVINDVNSTGFGLTLGIHSRINATVEYISKRIHVGNCYVNRSMTGAVVGLQPFGGEGLSGTGPKAGGPLYLQRLCVERTFTVDTTAAGGNASLMSIPDA
jgi:RHH-type transcriptional regulator, proline utilization regulon repressor / proline dehydrogenase / delta 1-pyrroline-5-carboxylate dehydrogenase